MSDLRAWLAKELKERRLSQRELARQSGISQAVISQTISGDVAPSVNFCLKVALALGEAPEKIFRLAGILPPSEDDPALQELFDMLRNMPPEQRKEALRYIRFLYQSNTPGK